MYDYDSSTFGSQPPEKRYWGMTKQQATILGVMAAFALILVAVAGFLAISLMLNGGAAPAAEPVVQVTVPPTSTPAPTATPKPTDTPAPTATVTPRPTITPIPGWKEFKGQGLSIWLPEGYIGGNAQTERDSIVSQIIAAGGPLAKDTSSLEQMFTSQTDFLALDPVITEATGFMLIHILHIDQPKNSATLDDYMEQVSSYQPSSLRQVGRETKELEGIGQVGRMVFSGVNGNVYQKEIVYVIPGDQRMWMAAYVISAVSKEVADTRIALVDQSFQTFILQP
jgi:hypothetical protein